MVASKLALFCARLCLELVLVRKDSVQHLVDLCAFDDNCQVSARFAPNSDLAVADTAFIFGETRVKPWRPEAGVNDKKRIARATRPAR